MSDASLTGQVFRALGRQNESGAKASKTSYQLKRLRPTAHCNHLAAIKRRILIVVVWRPSGHQRTIGGGLERDDDKGSSFLRGPKSVRKTKAWLERARLTLAAAREQATEMAMAREKVAPQRMMRPTVLQRHRLAKRLSSAAEA